MAPARTHIFLVNFIFGSCCVLVEGDGFGVEGGRLVNFLAFFICYRLMILEVGVTIFCFLFVSNF